MKTLYTTLVLLLLTLNLWGQVPQQFSYQAVVRDENGQLVKNQKISVQISLLKDAATGTLVYQEKHEPSTDANGLFSMQIGTGKLLTGDFSKIDWSTGIYYVMSEIDLKGGSNYTIAGTSQLLSVPYAFYAANSTPGAKGDKGDAGLPGNDGKTGPQGEKGDKGDAGLPGNDGKTGPQGDKGDKGDAGLPGKDGLTGPQGDKGDKGDAGLPGKDGLTGPQGDKGDKGDAGLPGKDGLTGPQGDKGDKGDAGLPGKDGLTGPQGDKGDKGDAGLPGKDGLTGPQGDKGDKGDAGLLGKDGLTGPQGDKGDKGDTGLPGKDGLIGPQGEKGDKGDAGLPGNDGLTGPQGEKGDKGDAGLPGNDGQTGTQGDKGDKGDTGPAGNDGKQGAKGDKGDKGDGFKSGTTKNQLLFWDGAEWSLIPPGTHGQTLTVCDGVLTWTSDGKCPEVSTPTSGYGQNITDVDGNTYKTVYIGTQQWMAENLKTSKYNDGVSIPLITNQSDWTSTFSPARTVYNFQEKNNKIYGQLYNWLTVDVNSNNNKNVCPVGWHVPTEAEWEILTQYLMGREQAGGTLKAVGYDVWAAPNLNASNSSLFTGLPGGYMGNDGNFYNLTNHGHWWSSTVRDNRTAFARNLNASDNQFLTDFFMYGKEGNSGLSVRCIKD